ncbi:M23 family metallopeptidase [Nocardioides aequoreus]|uniref:M23 family metallopeptidase n=1 Tax=Nocardioides aequoreus TaxID=397278 RepID=UPI0012F6E8B2|nr:M23 family metallopeptidase [Nocardioides aequoreus]
MPHRTQHPHPYKPRHRAQRHTRHRTAARRPLAAGLLSVALSATLVAAAPGPSVAADTAVAPPGATITGTVVAGTTLQRKPPRWYSPVDQARLTARFGQTGLWASTHTGLDFAAPEGTPLRAIGAGVVESAGYDGAYGNKLVLRLADGTRLWYCHLSAFSVAPGDRVAAGGEVGALGSTGNSTGPHLHLEVQPPSTGAVDPEPWLAERGVL